MDFDIRLLQKIFPSILFSTYKRSVHLTFDDGPHPEATPAVLDILNKFNVRATFFLLGQNVKKYPELAKQIYLEGHQIGNHAYSHTNLFFKKKSLVKREILQTEEMIYSIIGKHTDFFRPSYGYFGWTTFATLKELELTCVLWNVDSKDYKLKADDIQRRVIKKTTNGSIILFHDNNDTSLKLHNYLPNILETLLGRGFIFDTL